MVLKLLLFPGRYGLRASICCTINPMSRCSPVLQVLFLSFLGLSLLAAAPKKPKKGTPPPAVSGAAAGIGVDPKSYVIGPEDILLIRVWRDTEVSGVVMVRPDGKITLQLLGEIQAAGLTPEALTQVIFDGLSKLKTLDKSEVTVSIQTVNSKKYYIQGEVGKSGGYPLLIPTTVLEALVNAGGFKDFANKKKIVIIRNGTRYHFNYKEVVAGKKMEQNILLQPGDQIIVP
jgi:polysaccharide export outer membrane protein